MAIENDAQNPEHFEDEEYHFSEEPETPPPFVPSGGGNEAKPAKSSKQRKILLLIGLVVVAFCVYKLLDILFTARGKSHLPTTTATTQVSALPSSAVTTTTQTQAPVAVAIPGQSREVMAGPVNERLQSLEQKSATSQAVLDKLSSQISQLQGTLADLNSHVTSVTDSVQSINTKIAQQQAEAKAQALAGTKAKEVKRKLAIKKIRETPKPVYFVRAMVQGRAWLSRGCEGGTLTVAIGDTIPGYGIVRLIDPHQGTLTTSAGAIIGYSPEDS